jgi:hypothetical protein
VPALAPPAGIFAGIHSRPGDLVDALTRSGSFAFLSDLFYTERLFELRDFRIARVMPKGEASQQFATSMHLVLGLADKYPRDSLAAHILDVVAQFLLALLTPCTRRGRVRQIVSNAKRFQRGEWKGLWETALLFARKETDTKAKRNHNRAKRDTSIRARVAYAEHYARQCSGEIWRRCFASLAVNAGPVQNEAAKLLTSTYDNFIQTAGIRDGASHCAKILSIFYDSLDTTDLHDPEVIIKIDISNI